jgi:hypothetical protein
MENYRELLAPGGIGAIGGTSDQEVSVSDEAVAASKAKKERSPNFPFISLKKAVERAEALHSNHKREAARLVAIAPSWGYGPKSSGLMQTVAALKQFGLVEDSGSGDDRKVQVSEFARRIIVDQRPGAREEAIKEAARKPRLIGEYIDKWVPDRPSDAHCISELELDRGFSADAARAFLRIFDETVAYAKLDEDADDFDSLLRDPSPAPAAAEPRDKPASEARLDIRDMVSGMMPPVGPKPLSDRLQVTINGNRVTVAASLITQDEVDTLIRILEVNKVVLPQPPSPPPPPPPPPPRRSPTSAGEVDMD